MKRFTKSFLSLLIASSLILGTGAFDSFAEESELAENIETTTSTEQGSPVDASNTSESTEQASPVDAGISEQAGNITGFSPIEEITNEYKLGLERQLELLPETIEVTFDDGTVSEIAVLNWNCNEDYDEILGEYTFTPEISADYKLADDVNLPVATVTVENENDINEEDSGYLDVDLGYEVPSLEDNGDSLESSEESAELNGASASYYDLYSQSENSYNSFEEGVLPELRNQGSEGACWAFASIGAIEADLIHDGDADTSIDLSELALTYFETHSYTDPTGCNSGSAEDKTTYTGSSYVSNGGTAVVAYRLFANGVGPIDEKYAPYSLGSSYTADEDDALNENYCRIENVYNISTTDFDGIKAAIKAHGGVTASYYSNSSRYYSATYNSYYDQYSGGTNHEIMLVGWDDDFPAENYRYGTAAGDGAWLVRDSYGLDDYGYYGYFWISYYDMSLQHSGRVTAYETSTTTYDNTYSYVHMFSNTASMGSSSGANTVVNTTYSVEAGQSIKAVGIEVPTTNNTISVSVTDGANTVSGTTSTTYAGFYTVNLDDSLSVTTDSTVTVTVTIGTSVSDGSTGVILEYASSSTPNKPKYTVSYGSISYTYANSGNSNVNGKTAAGDVRMMMYTDDIESGEDSSSNVLTLDTDKVYDYGGSTHQLSISAPSGVTTSDVAFTSTDSSIAEVSSAGLVTLKYKSGTCVIRARYNNQTAEVTVTVKPYFVTYKVTEDVKFTKKSITFYPGSENNFTPSTPYRPGYDFAGWYTDEGLTTAVDTTKFESTTSHYGDIELYPKWTEHTLTIYYYQPSDDFTSYKDGTDSGTDDDPIKFAEVKISAMPATVVSLITTTNDPQKLDTVVEYNKDNEEAQKYFKNMATDYTGTTAVTAITVSDFNFRRVITDGTSGSSYIQNDTLYLFPVYEDKPILPAVIASIPDGSFVELGQEVKLTESVENSTIYYRVNGSSYVTYSGAFNITKSLISEYGKVVIDVYGTNEDYSKGTLTTYTYYPLIEKNNSALGDVDYEDLVYQCTQDGSMDDGFITVGEIPTSYWLGGINETLKYTGKALTYPDLKVYYNTRLLTLGTDYSVKYSNNINAAASTATKAPTLKITAKGGYSGSFTQKFTIEQASLSDCLGSVPTIYASYNNGKVVKPTFSLTATVNGVTRKLTTSDFTWSCGTDVTSGCSSLGTHTLTLTGKGNYKETTTVSYVITDAKLMSKASVKVAAASITDATTVNGNTVVEPTVKVYYGGKLLTAGTDYSLSFSNNDEPGTASVTVKGIGSDFIGNKTVNFTISGVPINKNYSIENFEKSFVYSGKANTQDGIVLTVNVGKENEKLLTAGTDYNVTYKRGSVTGSADEVDLTSVGTVTMIITGSGKYYTGTIKKTYKITAYNVAKDMENGSSALISVSLTTKSVPYAKGGATNSPLVTFNVDGKSVTLTEGTDYTVTYSGNTKLNNSAYLLIKGKGNFTGAQTKKLLNEWDKLDDQTFSVVHQSINNLTLIANDRAISKTKTLSANTCTYSIVDLNGKKLKAGTDYNAKTVVYYFDADYKTPLTMSSTVNILSGNDRTIYFTVDGCGNYNGIIKGSYRLTKFKMSECTATVSAQAYTGDAVTIDQSDISIVNGGGKVLSNDQYEIDETTYKNNTKTGKASVVLRGKDAYSGTKTVYFQIKKVSW